MVVVSVVCVGECVIEETVLRKHPVASHLPHGSWLSHRVHTVVGVVYFAYGAFYDGKVPKEALLIA